jgi:ABC-type transporter Mla subunit MlaD
MDLGDISKMLDNTPMDKVSEVVEFFMDHRDELDKLIGLVQAAPALIAKVGDALDDAGEHAKDAALAIAGKTRKGGAAATLAAGSGTLANVGSQLAEAASLLDDMASFMAKVEIPHVEPTFTKVAGVDIVSGLDIGKDMMLADPAMRLASAADTLGKAKGDLDNLAKNLESLADTLASVGGALDKLGDGLKNSGLQASKLFD